VTSVAPSGEGERERLIIAHLPLVDSIAGRFVRSGERREDLVQVGALALVRAVDRRDPARPSELSAYVARCVDGEIRRYLRDGAGSIRLPRRVHEDLPRLRLVRSELAASLGREPAWRDVAREAGVADEAAPGGAVETARRPLQLRDDLAGADAELDEAMLARALVARAARSLSPRERRLVLLRFFLDWSQADVAAALGVSQAQVSRLLDGAMAKMRRTLESPAALCRTRRSATLGADGDGDEPGSGAGDRGERTRAHLRVH